MPGSMPLSIGTTRLGPASTQARYAVFTSDESLGGCSLENRHWNRSIRSRRCAPGKRVPSERKSGDAGRVIPVRKGSAVHFEADGAFLRVHCVVAEVCAGAHDGILVLFGRASRAVV